MLFSKRQQSIPANANIGNRHLFFTLRLGGAHNEGFLVKSGRKYTLRIFNAKSSVRDYNRVATKQEYNPELKNKWGCEGAEKYLFRLNVKNCPYSPENHWSCQQR